MIGQNELPKLSGLIVRASRAREDFADRRVEVSEKLRIALLMRRASRDLRCPCLAAK